MTLTDEQKQYLEGVYYNLDNVAALRGPAALYNHVKGDARLISLDDIKAWLEGQPTYTIWRPARKTYPRNSIRATAPAELFQFDLADFHLEPEDGMQYLFVGIDSYSRFVFVAPMKDRKSKNVISVMEQILATGYKPKKALSDPAGEFVSRITRSWFKKNQIHLYFTSSKIHAPQAECWIRTLRTRLRRYRNAYNTKKWIEASEKIAHNYNRTRSRVTGQAPLDILASAKSNFAAYTKLFLGKKRAKPKTKMPKQMPAVGEYVRLNRIKGPFEKEATVHGNWTKEIFKVTGVDRTKEEPMFKLEDLNGKPVKGSAYLPEVQKIDYRPTEQLFEIEKIVRRKKVRGRVQCLVKWKDYGTRFNSWLPLTEVHAMSENVRNV